MIPQYLYLDTTSVKVRTVPRIVEAVAASLDGILANGPLEIVVADPEPTVALASSSNREQVREALARLPTKAVGKDLARTGVSVRPRPSPTRARSSRRSDSRTGAGSSTGTSSRTTSSSAPRSGSRSRISASRAPEPRR